MLSSLIFIYPTQQASIAQNVIRKYCSRTKIMFVVHKIFCGKQICYQREIKFYYYIKNLMFFKY